MTIEQAEALQQRILADFPTVFTGVYPSSNTRNAPAHFFVGVKRELGDGAVLILHHEYEYNDCLTALAIFTNYERKEH